MLKDNIIDKKENVVIPQLWQTIIHSGNLERDDLFYRYAYYSDYELIDNLVTYEELAKWLSTGNGELLSNNEIKNYIEYYIDIANKQVPDHFLIRPYNTKKWLIPTYENLKYI